MNSDKQNVDNALHPVVARHCSEGEKEPLDPITGQCNAGMHTHCPFCGASDWDHCEHQIAFANYESDDGFVIWAPLDLAESTVELPNISVDKNVTAADWLREFGDLSEAAEQLRTYGKEEAFAALLKRVSVPVETFSWTGDGMASAWGADWYSSRPDDSCREVARLITKLRHGFKELGVLNE